MAATLFSSIFDWTKKACKELVCVSKFLIVGEIVMVLRFNKGRLRKGFVWGFERGFIRGFWWARDRVELLVRRRNRRGFIESLRGLCYCLGLAWLVFDRVLCWFFLFGHASRVLYHPCSFLHICSLNEHKYTCRMILIRIFHIDMHGYTRYRTYEKFILSIKS